MSPRPKAPSFGLLLALPLILSAGPADARSAAELHQACVDMLEACQSYCDKNEKVGSAAHRKCNASCRTAYDDCGEKAWNMTAPKAPSKPNLQPKLQPGGAEQPSTETRGVRSKGGGVTKP